MFFKASQMAEQNDDIFSWILSYTQLNHVCGYLQRQRYNPQSDRDRERERKNEKIEGERERERGRDPNTNE